MATAAAERFASIAHRRRQFRAALRVAAALPQIGQIPDCILTGVVCAGNKGHDGYPVLGGVGNQTKKDALVVGASFAFQVQVDFLV
jgi:hypothetical protein